MDRENFIQSSVRIRHLEKSLLTKQQFERLADCKDLQEVIRFLNETSYSSEISKLDRIENYETILSNTLNKTYKEVFEISSEKSIVDCLQFKYLYHNLKVCVKEKLLNEDFDTMYSLFDRNEILDFKQKILDSNIDISKYYKMALYIFEKSKDPQDIDIFLDRECFKNILDLVKKFNLNMIENYFKAMIDFTNIRTFIRCKRQKQSKEVLEKSLIEGGEIQKDEILALFFNEIETLNIKFKSSSISKVLSLIIEEYKNTSSLSNFEKYVDDYLMDLIKETNSINYGAEVIFAYLIAKELEIKNLRLVLVGKVNDLSAEFIKERLREVYV